MALVAVAPDTEIFSAVWEAAAAVPVIIKFTSNPELIDDDATYKAVPVVIELPTKLKDEVVVVPVVPAAVRLRVVPSKVIAVEVVKVVVLLAYTTPLASRVLLFAVSFNKQKPPNWALSWIATILLSVI